MFYRVIMLHLPGRIRIADLLSYTVVRTVFLELLVCTYE